MRAALALFMLMALAPLDADAFESLTAEGSVRTYLVSTEYPGGEDTSQGLVMLRLKLSGDIISEQLRFELAYEAVPTWRDSPAPEAFLTNTPDSSSFRLDDINENLYPALPDSDTHLLVPQNLDRAFISYRAEAFDLTVGRQPISFGSAHVINPTDILAPYAYETLAKEERIGVDAARIRIPTGDFSEIDVALGLGEDADRDSNAALIRVKGYALETDITVMAMNYGQNTMLGMNLARSIGDASAWIEAAYTEPSDNQLYLDSSPYTRLSTGVDRAMTGNFYTYLEYHYNGAGAEEVEDYLNNTLKAAYIEGRVGLLGRNYLAPGLTYQITPLISASASALINIDDGSALLAPLLTYSASDNATASLGAFVGAGDPPATGDSTPRSEFGSYPDIYYASYKYYF